MTDADAMKKDLHAYLHEARQALLWKLDGLSEYDARRPLVRSGTNLLGIVKHVAWVESGYFGVTFGLPFPEEVTWSESDPNSDMWARADESRQSIISLYHRVWVHSDRTIGELALDAVGRVPWWPEDRNQVSLHRILVHMTAETHHHAGHADIVRELIDGSLGLRQSVPNLPDGDDHWWADYRDRVEQAARQAAGI
jgi:uncharacterized damage-inducible protein DinB